MACWQNSPTCERTSPLRFWRTIICEMRALLSPIVSIIERAGSGSRCASVLTFTGTGDGCGAPPPLIAASAAFSMTCTSPTRAIVSSIGALPPPSGGDHVAAQSDEAVVDDALDPLAVDAGAPRPCRRSPRERP